VLDVDERDAAPAREHETSPIGRDGDGTREVLLEPGGRVVCVDDLQGGWRGRHWRRHARHRGARRETDAREPHEAGFMHRTAVCARAGSVKNGCAASGVHHRL
jgi:hypothetical protein